MDIITNANGEVILLNDGSFIGLPISDEESTEPVGIEVTCSFSTYPGASDFGTDFCTIYDGKNKLLASSQFQINKGDNKITVTSGWIYIEGDNPKGISTGAGYLAGKPIVSGGVSVNTYKALTSTFGGSASLKVAGQGTVSFSFTNKIPN